MQSLFFPVPCLAVGAPRCSAAATFRKRTTSMMMRGQICRGMGEPSCGLGYSDGGKGRTFFATTGITYEDREGGTLPGKVLAATGQQYVEALETQRYDAGGLGQFLLKGRYAVSARAAFARQSH